MKYINSFKIFEYGVGPKIKSNWDVNDQIIVLYYYKYGFEKIGIHSINDMEQFIGEHFGVTLDSFEMQTKAMEYIFTGYGLPNGTNTQKYVANKYGNYSEPKLRKIVEDILDNIDSNRKQENLIKYKKRKKYEENQKLKRLKKLKKDKFKEEKEKSFKYKKRLNDIDTTVTTNINLEIGNTIKHKKFGIGKILDIIKNDKYILIVNFYDIGVKKIMYIPNIIEKID